MPRSRSFIVITYTYIVVVLIVNTSMFIQRDPLLKATFSKGPFLSKSEANRQDVDVDGFLIKKKQ